MNYMSCRGHQPYWISNYDRKLYIYIYIIYIGSQGNPEGIKPKSVVVNMPLSK